MCAVPLDVMDDRPEHPDSSSPNPPSPEEVETTAFDGLLEIDTQQPQSPRWRSPKYMDKHHQAPTMAP